MSATFLSPFILIISCGLLVNTEFLTWYIKILIAIATPLLILQLTGLRAANFRALAMGLNLATLVV